MKKKNCDFSRQTTGTRGVITDRSSSVLVRFGVLNIISSVYSKTRVSRFMVNVLKYEFCRLNRNNISLFHPEHYDLFVNLLFAQNEKRCRCG